MPDVTGPTSEWSTAAGPSAAGCRPGELAADFFALLLRDAPAAEYERPLAAARAAGAGEAVLADLVRTRLLALQLRDVLTARKRREAELTALFDTARDLAALREVDAVLPAIVHRARQLLGTDVSYLTLNDPERGNTYMRVADGSVSARFQALRLGMGEGLGGLVAQTAKPYVTASYPTDDRFLHTGDIDGAVNDEGLVAILGVPLLLGSRVLGVLYAADRSQRTFDHSEVALLVSLAAHAAIALDNAQRLQQTRTALEEVSRTTRQLRARTASVERAASAHDRFIDIVLAGGGLEEVAEAVVQTVGGRIALLDEQGRVAPTDGATWSAELPSHPARALELARASGRTVREGMWWTAAVTADSELLGGLVLQHGDELSEADQRILERAALVSALLLLTRRSRAEAEHRVRGELLTELLTAPHRDPSGLRDRARRLGADLDRPHAVVVAAVEGPHRDRALAAAAHLAAVRGGLAGRHGDGVVVCLPDADPATAAATVARDLETAGAVTAGGAGPVSGPDGLAEGYAEAARCVSALLALGRRGSSASAAELGFIGLLLGRHRDVGAFVRTTVGPLLEYDSRRGTDLAGTLRAWFAAGGSPARAALTLGVHVNTVTQRLDRVAHLLGADWSSAERALEIQLALRLDPLTTLADDDPRTGDSLPPRRQPLCSSPPRT